MWLSRNFLVSFRHQIVKMFQLLSFLIALLILIINVSESDVYSRNLFVSFRHQIIKTFKDLIDAPIEIALPVCAKMTKDLRAILT